jgi:LuxR family transcriptional regulator, maltose regulon positive regulatory protein
VSTRTKGPRSSRRPRRRSWFVPLESKLHVPANRPGLVLRTHLIEHLRTARASALVVVLGPPGYGKTTLLTQWGEADERPFVWVTIDDADNDPSRLLTYIVFALDEVVSLGAGIFPRPPEAGPAFTAFALPRLTHALAQRAKPFVLVLDDVHLLRNAESLDLVSILAQNLPAGCQLVLAGRDLPPLPLSRLLVDNSLLALGVRQLAMTPREGGELLHAAGLPVGASEIAMLVERTEGWAAGLYLAALALREQPHLGDALAAFAGSDELLSRYIRDELLERLSPDKLEFMLGTAALDRLCGPLCDAVLQTSGSSEMLEELERANLLIMPTDRNRVWFRRHQLFGEMLLTELRKRDPEAKFVQHRRAAEWFERMGNPDAAMEHALAARDYTFAAGIVANHVEPYLVTSRAATLRRWIEMIPSTSVSGLPWFGAAASLAYVSSGDIERSTQWMAVAERADDDDASPAHDGRASLRSAVAISRAALALGGAGRLLKDATLGYDLEPKDSPWRGLCAFLQGVALYLTADIDGARAKLEEARELGNLEQPNVHAWTLSQLAVLELSSGQWDAARGLAENARVEVERNSLQEYAPAALMYAVSALTCAHSRQPAEARRDAAHAARLLAMLSGLAPWLSVEARILLADTYLLFGDAGAARESLRSAGRDLPRLGEAPTLRRWWETSNAAAATQRSVSTGPPLTPAEIRVLQFLPTHLSFREIADRLHVSRNTVKTQVISSYRKLGASNRTEAVDSARNLAIIEG